MKVQELIAKLSKLPPDTEIHFDGYEDDEAEEVINELVQDTLEEAMDVNVKRGWGLLPLKEKDLPAPNV